MIPQQTYFPTFRENTFIQTIANDKRWTVSTADKVPIDMHILKYRNEIKGAFHASDLCLMTLDEVNEIIPNASNHAYHFDYQITNAIVLDIEPKCPEILKKSFLEMNYIYGEISLSGKGLHLIFPVPECFDNYPIAQQKKVLKEEHGYYEFLLYHYVTFTHNMLPEATGTNTIDTVFETLCRKQKESVKTDTDINLTKPEIPKEKTLLKTLCHIEYKKTPNDFYGDMSKYEYGFTGFYHSKLKKQIQLPHYKSHTYTDNEKAWLLYEIAMQKLEHRANHDENRNGLPWLLYLAQEIIAKDITRNKSQ